MKTEGEEHVFVYLILSAMVSLLFTVALVLLMYGYMDHTNNVVALRVGEHNSRCIHQVCDLTQAPR